MSLYNIYINVIYSIYIINQWWLGANELEKPKLIVNLVIAAKDKQWFI